MSGTDIDNWKQKYEDVKALYDTKLQEYDDLKKFSEEYEVQTEQLLEDAQEEADRANKELLEFKQENDKLNRIRKDYLNIKEKYHSEVREVEAENETLNAKLKDITKKFNIMEMETEDLERRNQAFESAIENWEEKIDSLLEEIALTQSERDDTKAIFTEQIEKLNQQLEEMQMELDVKDKQIKKYKFLQILHDYGTTADEILDKAANPARVPGRGSTVLPNNSRNKDYWVLSNQSDTKLNLTGKYSDIADIINDSKQRERRNSIDFMNLSESKNRGGLINKLDKRSQEMMKLNRRSSVEILSPTKANQSANSRSENNSRSRNTDEKQPNMQNQRSNPFTPAIDLNLQEQSPRSNTSFTKQLSKMSQNDSFIDISKSNTSSIQPSHQPASIPQSNPNNKYVSFGTKAQMKNQNSQFVINNSFADVDALLEYEGHDLDSLAMDNSKDALRVIQGLEDLIDSRINFLMDSSAQEDLQLISV